MVLGQDTLGVMVWPSVSDSDSTERCYFGLAALETGLQLYKHTHSHTLTHTSASLPGRENTAMTHRKRSKDSRATKITHGQKVLIHFL